MEKSRVMKGSTSNWHLHIHLTSQRKGEGLNHRMVKGTVVEQRLPGGAALLVGREHPPNTDEEMRAALRIASAFYRLTGN